VRATSNGIAYQFSPSFSHIDRIGSPEDIVEAYSHLYSLSAKTAVRTAMLVMNCCCDDEPEQLIGYLDNDLARVGGEMPITEMMIIARHLMQHGIVGLATAKESTGQYSPRFDASEYVDSAVIHFGLSQVEAWALTMTQFCRMLDMKFPQIKEQAKREITPEKYDDIVADYEKLRAIRLEKAKAQNGN